MKRTAIIVAALLICIGLPIANSSETVPTPSPDLKLERLIDEFEREKLELKIELNTSYIEKIEARLKSAMKEGDLPAANQADSVLKKLLAEKDALVSKRESADLIASLAGDWEIVTTRYRFKVFPNGRVIPLDKDEPYIERRMVVVDLEKRHVKFNKVVWKVTEGSKSLWGSKHPAQRINTEK